MVRADLRHAFCFIAPLALAAGVAVAEEPALRKAEPAPVLGEPGVVKPPRTPKPENGYVTLPDGREAMPPKSVIKFDPSEKAMVLQETNEPQQEAGDLEIGVGETTESTPELAAGSKGANRSIINPGALKGQQIKQISPEQIAPQGGKAVNQ